MESKQYSPWDYRNPAVSIMSAAFTMLVRAPIMLLGFIFFTVNYLLFIYPIYFAKKIKYYSNALFLGYVFLLMIVMVAVINSHGSSIFMDLLGYWSAVHMTWVNWLGAFVEYGAENAFKNVWHIIGTIVVVFLYFAFVLQAWRINYDFTKERDINGSKYFLLPISVLNAIRIFILPTFYWKLLKAVFTMKTSSLFSFDDMNSVIDRTMK